jgi:hypothetical protein
MTHKLNIQQMRQTNAYNLSREHYNFTNAPTRPSNYCEWLILLYFEFHNENLVEVLQHINDLCGKPFFSNTRQNEIELAMFGE